MRLVCKLECRVSKLKEHQRETGAGARGEKDENAIKSAVGNHFFGRNLPYVHKRSNCVAEVRTP